MKAEKIAVIGGGISGLTAAFRLKEKYHVTVFEKQAQLGGHAASIILDNDYLVEAGVCFFEPKTYPETFQLFRELNISLSSVPMNYGIFEDNNFVGSLNSSLWQALYLNHKFISPQRLKLLLELLHFRNVSHEEYDLNKIGDISFGEYLQRKKVSAQLCKKIIFPICGLIFGGYQYKSYDSIPADYVIGFIKLAGIFYPESGLDWYRVSMGTQEYITKMVKSLQGPIHLNCAIQKLARDENNITVTFEDGSQQIFDKVIIATSPKDALAMKNCCLVKAPGRVCFGVLSYTMIRLFLTVAQKPWEPLILKQATDYKMISVS
jgi:predicted NAD/FAD-binding protein